MRRVANVVLAATAIAVSIVAVLAFSGGGSSYYVSVPLANAYGLTDGSAVRLGGTDQGTVKLRLTGRDQVVADLRLDPSAGRVGKDARVVVVAADFLGQKRVELIPGHPQSDPAPSGYALPASSVSAPTDLDQVLGIFGPRTRTRAMILLDAAGQAVLGRRVDIQTLLGELPTGLGFATSFLGELTTDNATMRALVTRSDGFVAQAASQGVALKRMIDAFAGTATTIAARRGELAQTLARAPRTLAELRSFSQDLSVTAGDLGPAARLVTSVSPYLSSTLAQVDGFRRAANPTLIRATALAPDLSRLAVGATPVLRSAVPTALALANVATSLPPVSHALDHSADNIIAIVQNWSRAIQFRDGLGHVFRGEASVSPDLLIGAIQRLAARIHLGKSAARPAQAGSSTSKPAVTPSTPSVTDAPPTGAGTATAPLAGLLGGLGATVKNLPQTASKVIGTVLGGLTGKLRLGTGPHQNQDHGVSLGRLLGYLLKP
ncbi:MAG: MlaD family protein [Solirubrobacteraceae bacterium]